MCVGGVGGGGGGGSLEKGGGGRPTQQIKRGLDGGGW